MIGVIFGSSAIMAGVAAALAWIVTEKGYLSEESEA